MVRSTDMCPTDWRAADTSSGRRRRTCRSARTAGAKAVRALAALAAFGALLVMPAIVPDAQAQAHPHVHPHAQPEQAPEVQAKTPPAVASPTAPQAVAEPVAPGEIRVEKLTAHTHLISSASANLVLLADDEATFVAGVQQAPLVARARTLVQELGARPVRYALVMEDPASLPAGDGGWAEQGAVTFIQEMLYRRMYAASHSMKKGQPPAIVLDHPSPKVGFSQVIQVLLKTEDVHVIHARAGYTDADVIVHFEGSGIVYLGNTFTTDGYPHIDAAHGGDVNGILTTIEYFAARAVSFPETVAIIVPGRGPAVKGEGLREFRDMLVATRDRVLALIKQGKTLADVVAAKPSASFDERWGRGPVTPDAFVTSLFKVLAPR